MVRYMVVPGGVADGATAEAEAEAKAEVVAEAEAEVDACSWAACSAFRVGAVSFCASSLAAASKPSCIARPLNERSPVDGVLLLKLSYRNWGSPFYAACAASEQTPPG